MLLLSDLPLQIDYVICYVRSDTPARASVSLNHFCRVEKHDDISVIMPYRYSWHNKPFCLHKLSLIGVHCLSFSESEL